MQLLAILCLVFMVCVAIPRVHSQSNVTIELYGKLDVENSGFVTLYRIPPVRKTNFESNWTLLVAAFNAVPFAKSKVFAVTDLSSKVENVSTLQTSLIQLADNLAWPNEVSGLPVSSQLYARPVAVVPGGFIVPTHTNGAISLIDISSGRVPAAIDISSVDSDTTQWFYHRVLWKDMNGDGLLDAVTCRARQPFPGFSTVGQFVWFENPGTPVISPSWKPHVLGAGPDVFFTNVSLTLKDVTYDCFVMAQFFSKKLSIYWTTDSKRHWTNASNVHSRVIDDSIGKLFEVKILDLNGDGRLDILATVNDDKNGTMWAFEIPDDFRTGTFKRHLLASGYAPKPSIMPGRGAPGSPAILRLPGMSSKPHILLSGDDEGSVTLYTPASRDPNIWAYNRRTLFKSTGTVGELAVGDVQEDGWPVMFVPTYNEGKVYIYKFKKA